MKFSIGQKVWASCDRPELGRGELQAVVIDYTKSERLPYIIEIEGCEPPRGHRGWSAKEEWLRPRDDDDTDKVSDWASLEAIFKPKRTEPVTVDGEELDYLH